MRTFFIKFKKDRDITKSIQSNDEQRRTNRIHELNARDRSVGSVQDFAFRSRPLSLLVAYAPVESHLFRFSRRSFRLALQSTARRV